MTVKYFTDLSFYFAIIDTVRSPQTGDNKKKRITHFHALTIRICLKIQERGGGLGVGLPCSEEVTRICLDEFEIDGRLSAR